MKKRMISRALVLSLVLTLPGCSVAGSKQDGGNRVYYLDVDGTGLTYEAYELQSSETLKQIDELIAALIQAPDEKDMMKLLPDGVEIDRSVYENGNLTLDFTEDYLSMEKSREILVRAGIVRTLVQIPAILTVSFTVAGQPVLGGDGMEIGPMTADSFVENAGRQVNAYQHADINLYFASDNGKRLVRESRAIYYSSNRSIEWAIVARLIAGPKGNNGHACIPAGTQIISISTVDGTCFVNLSDAFNTELVGIEPEVTVYSIVNSLIMSCNVTAVQFSIGGETGVVYRDRLNLDKPFTENMGLIEEAPSPTAKAAG